MPRGYLKHRPGIGKRSRGSSSRNYAKRSRDQTSARHLDGNARTDVDFSLESYSSRSSKNNNVKSIVTKRSTNVGYCCICCEDQVPLVKLFHNCNHDLACRTCLRKVHIEQAQMDVTQYSNLMKCFHPTCQLRLSEVQIQLLVNNQHEFKRHQRLSILSKSYKFPGSTTLHCQSCDHPCQFRSIHLVVSESSSTSTDGKLHTFACRSCGQVSGFIASKTDNSTTNQLKMLDQSAIQQERSRFAELKRREKIDLVKVGRLEERSTRRLEKMQRDEREKDVLKHWKTIIKVMGGIQSDAIGRNDGWTRCPSCRIMISKGDGCFHITCVCGREFHWEESNRLFG
jgi:hypothetical protein